MKTPNRNEQRKLVQQWDETGRELDAIRRAELRGMPYDWKAVDSLLRLADSYDGPEHTSSGLVEMQRYFMKLHTKYFPPKRRKNHFYSAASRSVILERID